MAEDKKPKVRTKITVAEERPDIESSNEHVVDNKSRAHVRSMVSVGIPIKDVALVMNISVPTLYKYYGHELTVGKLEVIHMVGRSVIKDALEGDRASKFFYLKCHGGWNETQEVLHRHSFDPYADMDVDKIDAKTAGQNYIEMVKQISS